MSNGSDEKFPYGKAGRFVGIVIVSFLLVFIAFVLTLQWQSFTTDITVDVSGQRRTTSIEGNKGDIQQLTIRERRDLRVETGADNCLSTDCKCGPPRRSLVREVEDCACEVRELDAGAADYQRLLKHSRHRAHQLIMTYNAMNPKVRESMHNLDSCYARSCLLQYLRYFKLRICIAPLNPRSDQESRSSNPSGTLAPKPSGKNRPDECNECDTCLGSILNYSAEIPAPAGSGETSL